jgi:hypothetical protein
MLGVFPAMDEETIMNIRARCAAGNYRRKETLARAIASKMKNDDWPKALMILMAVEYAALAEQADALDKKSSIFTVEGWRAE